MGEENELAQAYRQAYADNSPFLKEAKEKENIRELQGRHPGLVISNNEQNKHSPLITILPITSLKEGDEPYPFQVASYFQSKNGVILVDQIRTIDRKRFGERVGEAKFILRNSPRIQGALKQKNQAGKVFHLRTDIANVYNCYYKAKNKQTWDLAEFLQELEEEETTKAKPASDPNMVYLPSAEQVELVREVYYTSSGGANLEVEKAQLQPFIEQICGEGIPIQIIQPADRESKVFGGGVGEWEFGVETAIYGRGMPRVSLRMKEEDWGGVVSVGLNSKKHQLNKAKKLLELTFPPRNHLEALRGNWKGYYSIRINKQNPIIHHPGKILKEEFLTLAQISPSQLAKDIGVSSKKIKEIIAEEKDLNKNIATRLALYFSTAPTF
ncbi:20637_t:CDS:2 [Entrophospora sp. SA101]|nr:20637_t:CDS:2 [Entrophospora sp. SA101]